MTLQLTIKRISPTRALPLERPPISVSLKQAESKQSQSRAVKGCHGGPPLKNHRESREQMAKTPLDWKRALLQSPLVDDELKLLEISAVITDNSKRLAGTRATWNQNRPRLAPSRRCNQTEPIPAFAETDCHTLRAAKALNHRWDLWQGGNHTGDPPETEIGNSRE